MKQYEMLHVVYNMCDVTKILNSSIEEVETDDLDQYVHSRFPGKNVQIERGAKKDGTIVFDVVIAGQRQRLSFNEL